MFTSRKAYVIWARPRLPGLLPHIVLSDRRDERQGSFGFPELPSKERFFWVDETDVIRILPHGSQIGE